jgi:hypothetical protein
MTGEKEGGKSRPGRRVESGPGAGGARTSARRRGVVVFCVPAAYAAAGAYVLMALGTLAELLGFGAWGHVIVFIGYLVMSGLFVYKVALDRRPPRAGGRCLSSRNDR